MNMIQSRKDYQLQFRSSVEDPEKFWGDVADDFVWKKKWSKVLEWDFAKPEVKWFIGGKLNITENCLDRHLETRADQNAIIWEPSDPQDAARYITYRELHEQVCKVANMLKTLGVQKGDRVCIYMPMVPELAYAVLACARIGAVHSVVFAGFSAGSLVDRITDSGCTVVLTADGSMRGGKRIELKKIVDEALPKCPGIRSVVVFECIQSKPAMQSGRDHWWHDVVTHASTYCPAEEMDAEDLLFILYTSGSTGKPKGMVHTCGGYMVYTNYTFRTAFQYQDGEVYWCTADVGWITGHFFPRVRRPSCLRAYPHGQTWAGSGRPLNVIK
jgi:acetyl-CoA synthetase